MVACTTVSVIATTLGYDDLAALGIDIPDVANPGLLVMVHELVDGMGVQVTALNFGARPIEESIW